MKKLIKFWSIKDGSPNQKYIQCKSVKMALMFWHKKVYPLNLFLCLPVHPKNTVEQFFGGTLKSIVCLV